MTNDPQPAPAAPAVTRPSVDEQKPTSPAQPAPKAKSTARLKKKTKSQPKPLVIKATKAKAEGIASEISADLPEKLETEIKNYFGLRYRMGGGGKNGIDCSALVQKVYADVFDIDLPRCSWQQSRLDKMENVSESEIETGDLLFFGPRRARVNHVGIYLAGGYFLHAARSEGVTISRLDNQYWKSRWMLTKRVKGLQIGYSEEDPALEGALTQFSLDSAFSGDTATESIGFLEGGLKFNDWPEFRLTGFYTQTLNESAQRLEDSSSHPFQPLPYYFNDAPNGFRFSTVFSPLPWEGFRLIPSVTQITDNTAKADLHNNYQTLGLETWMALPASHVALFMAAHAQNRKNCFERPLGMSPDWRTLDFSFGVHYRFSDALRFSLSGTRAYHSDFEESEPQGRQNQLLEDISFRLNFQF
ncbi:MAG: C40 family peptidase [Desulfatitalea sp.]